MTAGRGQKAFAAIILVSLVVSSFVVADFSGFDLLNLNTAAQKTSDISPGRLVVYVNFTSAFPGLAVPLGGVQVNVTRLGTFGFPLSSQTDGSGMVGMDLAPGPYLVAVGNSKFKVSPTLSVFQGQTTRLFVTVNRTEYASTFSDLMDSDHSGTLDSWETMTLAVGGRLGGPVIVIFPNFSFITLPAPAKFGSTVFVQPVVYIGGNVIPLSAGGMVQRLPEVKANVLSQYNRSGVTWLTLEPVSSMPDTNVVGVYVVQYDAGYKVELPVD